MPADQDRSRLPLPEPEFKGGIGKTYLDSKEDWPKVPTPPDGAPNVVVILLDDVGFGQASSFGGPVPTPALRLIEAIEALPDADNTLIPEDEARLHSMQTAFADTHE